MNYCSADLKISYIIAYDVNIACALSIDCHAKTACRIFSKVTNGLPKICQREKL